MYVSILHMRRFGTVKPQGQISFHVSSNNFDLQHCNEAAVVLTPVSWLRSLVQAQGSQVRLCLHGLYF